MVIDFRPEELIIEKLPGDLMTPLTIYQLLRGNYKFLLESSLKQSGSGRYSFIGANPAFQIRGYEDCTEIQLAGGTKRTITINPLDYVKGIFKKRQIKKSHLPFIGGAVGYVGYDAITKFYGIKNELIDLYRMPNLHLMFFEQIIAFDHLKEQIYIIGVPLLKKTTKEELKNSINDLIDKLSGRIQVNTKEYFKISKFKPEISREQFINMLDNTLIKMSENKVAQVVISQKMSANYEGDPFSYYRKLRLANPSPYMFYIDFVEYVITGSSPESLLKISNDIIVTNPIAGTRPRGKTLIEDEQFEQALLADEKEINEHNMLVELNKTELAQVCQPKTIKIEQYLQPEKYEHVIHLVSILSGKLKKSAHVIDGLIACMPAGTVSGVPKDLALKIIEQTEVSKRGPYGGAIGYFSVDNDCNLALAIRMAIFKQNKVFVQAGAGIVDGSVPKLEYEETLHKLKSLLN